MPCTSTPRDVLGYDWRNDKRNEADGCGGWGPMDRWIGMCGVDALSLGGFLGVSGDGREEGKLAFRDGWRCGIGIGGEM